jgi:hypothetical protein
MEGIFSYRMENIVFQAFLTAGEAPGCLVANLPHLKQTYDTDLSD